MAGEPKLPKYPSAPVKMGHSFFRQIRDRIETIAPIETPADSPLKVKYNEADGCEISLDVEFVTITVCVNGVPGEIEILRKRA